MRTQPHPQTRANVRVKTAALRNSRHHRYRISSRILESTTQRHANSREGRSGWVPGRQPLAQAGRGGAAARGREVGGAAAVIVHCHSGSLRFCCGAVAGGRWCVRQCARAAVGAGRPGACRVAAWCACRWCACVLRAKHGSRRRKQRGPRRTIWAAIVEPCASQ
jgi:hypothetical protein